ncbi:two-component system sensor histidine kinase NtrB [Rhodopirellula halodulae]|uniref:two-component system sensor histidine kinase NtrB n=1 Tax=Rhodopirellula halodulae TaxID=2894198 RepID=UPI001E4EDC8C|nr:PAS domain S-box protein [Rhodopirellula sp. JC737]MCC9656256.1 PAS domain S-box protein [Rhodopirellula sp. JC737]
MIQDHDHSLLAAILATAVDAIIVIDDGGIVRVINDATVRMFGYSESEIVGQNISMLMPSPYRDEHDGYLRDYQRTGIAKIIGIGREVQARRKDGTVFPINLAVSEVKMKEGRWFAGIIHDVTETKRTRDELAVLNDQLEERVREKTRELEAAQADLVKAERFATLGKVAGGIAHEIRNPLSVIRTSTYFLRHANDQPEAKRQSHLDRIERQVTMIDNVVTALVDVARLPEPSVVRCDVASVVVAVNQSLETPDSFKIDQRHPETLPPAKIDPNQVSIVFQNLLRNAMDAMPDGGLVQISSREENGFVVVRVTDHGPGIPPENMDRILEPLYSTKTRGMGLGLAICMVILQKNDGHLTVHNQPNAGAAFEVHLPIFGE